MLNFKQTKPQFIDSRQWENIVPSVFSTALLENKMSSKFWMKVTSNL